MYNFRNDYSYGAHPKVLSALAETNLEGNIGYGDDDYTSRAKDLIRDLCNCKEAEVQFLIGGTQTNYVALAFLLRPWESIIAPATGHINGHESGAVEAMGHKILPVSVGADGKLCPEQIPPILEYHQDVHLTAPRAVYISNATESGGVYTKAELTALSQMCRSHQLYLFMDGARLGCALASDASDVTLPDLAALVDAFYLGGTKNGALMGEALVIVPPALQKDFFRFKKQQGAVLAKGWLLGVQFEALLKDGLYFEMARHANALALRLQQGFKAKGYELWLESHTNQIFPIVTAEQRAALEKIAIFEDWRAADELGKFIIRFVTCFQTTQSDVDGLLAALPEL